MIQVVKTDITMTQVLNINVNRGSEMCSDTFMYFTSFRVSCLKLIMLNKHFLLWILWLNNLSNISRVYHNLTVSSCVI